LALVCKCFIFGCFAKKSATDSSSTYRSSVLSILLPTKMNGNLSGSFGEPWFKNSWIQDSMLSKDCRLRQMIPFCW
jgi:hypothetical protein